MKTPGEIRDLVDSIFSLSKEQLEQLRVLINKDSGFEDRDKDTMNTVIDNVIAYNERFRVIKKYIDEYDYYSLLEHGAPDDEFDSYSERIADIVSADDSVEKIAENIAVVFDEGFAEGVIPETYMDLAAKIKKALMDKKYIIDELDKGIDNMENGRVTPHEESMKVIQRQYNDYTSCSKDEESRGMTDEQEGICIEALRWTLSKEFPVSNYSIGRYKEDAVCIQKSEQSWMVYVGYRNTKDNLTEHPNVVEACIGMIKVVSGGNKKRSDNLIDDFLSMIIVNREQFKTKERNDKNDI